MDVQIVLNSSKMTSQYTIMIASTVQYVTNTSKVMANITSKSMPYFSSKSTFVPETLETSLVTKSVSNSTSNQCWWNDTSKFSETIPFLYEPGVANVGGLVATLFALCGFTFNFLVIASVMYHKKTREQTLTPFIISLCGSDLIYSIATLPFYAIRLFGRYA